MSIHIRYNKKFPRNMSNSKSRKAQKISRGRLANFIFRWELPNEWKVKKSFSGRLPLSEGVYM